MKCSVEDLEGGTPRARLLLPAAPIEDVGAGVVPRVLRRDGAGDPTGEKGVGVDCGETPAVFSILAGSSM